MQCTTTILFKILTSNSYDNPRVKISLYKKSELSAYNQNYTIIDLETYLIDNIFERNDENIYYNLEKELNNETLKINLNTSLLEKKGYMFVFELYDGERLLNKINQKFIIK